MTARPDASAGDVRARYQELYRGGRLSLSRNYSDKFPLLEHLLREEVRGRRVLDFGCGPGRLALMLARHAAHVHGVDYAGEGIELARLLARAAALDNVVFEEGDVASVAGGTAGYDVIVLAGVLEHLEAPVEQLAMLARRLPAGGLLCVQTPSFVNFRGDVYNTLGRLLGLPMSLTDLWQVTPAVMEAAAPRLGARLEKVVGGHYRFAFLERVVEDLRHRVPSAASDAGQGQGWRWEDFFAWLEERVGQNRLLLEAWQAAGALKPVPAPTPLPAGRPEGVEEAAWPALDEYLRYDGWREPWYSDVPPVCYYGASAVYFFRKGEEGR